MIKLACLVFHVEQWVNDESEIIKGALVYLCHLVKSSALQTVVWRERTCTLVVTRAAKKFKDCALYHQELFQLCSRSPPVHMLTSCQVPVPLLQALPYSNLCWSFGCVLCGWTLYLLPPLSWVFHVSRSSNSFIWISCLLEIKKLFVTRWLPFFFFFFRRAFCKCFSTIPLWKELYTCAFFSSRV